MSNKRPVWREYTRVMTHHAAVHYAMMNGLSLGVVVLKNGRVHAGVKMRVDSSWRLVDDRWITCAFVDGKNVTIKNAKAWCEKRAAATL
jgi:hypothetical protein